jgi:putative ABC transport system permease protein
MPPPRLARWLVSVALPAGNQRDAILGDLDEEYRLRAAQASIRAAAWWYWRAATSVAIRLPADRRRRHQRSQIDSAARASIMDALFQDIRQGVRTLFTARGFSTASIATLAIGIGAATAIFSIVNAMLLRPLPYPDSARVMWAAETNKGGGIITVSWSNFADWRARVTSLETLAASRGTTFTLTGVGDAKRIDGRQVTWNFISVLGGQPAIGRLFTPDDDRPSPVHPVVVSDTFWTTALGRDPSVLGRRLIIDGAPHEIVGVLRPGFRYLLDYAVYEPIGVLSDDESFLNRGNHQGLFALGRLKAGVALETAQQELATIAADLARVYPGTNTGQSARLMPLATRIIGDLKPSLVALMTAVGFLLLIACVNVANLLIAHGTTRRQELAVRAALGAGRLRLIRQLLVESALLSGLGGLLGIALGRVLLTVLIRVAPPTLPRLNEVRLDMDALLFALAAVTASSLLFGLLPAMIASRAQGQQLVVRASRSGTSASHRVRGALLTVEIALALVLLSGAGLMIRTMWQLHTADPGFRTDHLVTLKYAIRDSDWTDDRIREFHEQVLARTRKIPGVVSAAVTNSLPIDGSNWNSVYTTSDRPNPPRAELPVAAFTLVSTDLFETVGLRLQTGRLFSPSDIAAAPAVVIVNERLAKSLWPNENPIGKKVKQGFADWNGPWREIVGVVNDVKLEGVENDVPPQIYLPLAQIPERAVILLARTDPMSTDPTPAIRAVVGALNRDLPVYDVRTMEDVIGSRVARRQLSMLIFTVFAGIALALAAVGLYGVVSHGVADRTHEVGVRMALGATGRQVVRLFVRQTAVTMAVGIAIGVGGALWLAPFMQVMLFQVEPQDPATLAAVAAILIVVTLVASWIPAQRATRVSPTVALRGD